MTDPLKAIKAAIGIHHEAHRIGYDEDQFDVGYCEAISDALEIIEKLGGMDSLKRGKE